MNQINETLVDFIQAGGTWKELQKAFIKSALEVYSGNRTRAALAIGVSVRAVRYKMKEFHLREKTNGEET